MVTPLTIADAPPLDDNGILQRVPVILYIADAGGDGRFHYVSPQIEDILGYTPQEWCADAELWAKRLHPDDAERVLAQEEDFANGTPVTAAVEYRMLHRDSHTVWMRDEALMRAGADGIRRWHGVMSDVTAQKRVEEELELRVAQQAAVARIGELALRGASINDVMSEAVDVASALLDLEIGAIIELLPDGSGMAFRVTSGLPGLAPDTLVPVGKGSQAGYALMTGTAATVNDWDTETRFSRSPTLTARGAMSGITLKIEGRDGPFGVLGLHSIRRREFRQGDIDFAQALANILSDVVSRQHTDDAIRHQALHDPLTGLPNRLLFVDRCQQATERQRRRGGSRTAVLSLDLDQFKLVNDSLGHAVGDELLAAAAPRLRNTVRSSDTVARFGGDEFGILLEDVRNEHEAIEMAQRIAAVFTRPFVLDGAEHFVTTSIGIALAAGGERPEDLIRDADAAMNRAKERGRARYELFDEALRGRAISRLRVENDLRRALARDELTLDFQPIIGADDQALTGVEALVRWDHPERGRISPGEFIPVAEETGLIEPIGRWVLQHACRQAAEWHRLNPGPPRLRLTVNISAAQIGDPSLVPSVADALHTSGLPPDQLGLELTESVLAGDQDELAETLDALTALGVRLVLDDFGTGYSSLAYLSRLPFSVLKVDRSFVAGLGSRPQDTAVTEAIVAMARALSMMVVGEGAETAEQVAELCRIGCDRIQGFYFSRPVPAREITRMLHRGLPWQSPARRAA